MKRPKAPIRQSVFLFFLFFLYAAPAFCGGIGEPSVEQEVVERFAARPAVEIDLVTADCTVLSGPDGEIRIEVAHTHPAARYQAQMLELEDELRLREIFFGSSVRGRADWTVTVPQGTRVRFSASTGELKVRGDLNRLEARSAAGGISVEELEGEVELNTASGDVVVRKVRGDISIGSVSGAVAAADIRGRIAVRTTAGDIELQNAAAQVEASTTSGRIAVFELELEQESTFNSVSGDITVRLAASPAYDLTLTSVYGRVLLDFRDNPVVGSFEFSALRDAGRIVSPFVFDREQTFTHGGQTYLRLILVRNSEAPRIILSTAAGTVELRP